MEKIKELKRIIDYFESCSYVIIKAPVDGFKFYELKNDANFLKLKKSFLCSVLHSHDFFTGLDLPRCKNSLALDKSNISLSSARSDSLQRREGTR